MKWRRQAVGWRRASSGEGGPGDRRERHRAADADPRRAARSTVSVPAGRRGDPAADQPRRRAPGAGASPGQRSGDSLGPPGLRCPRLPGAAWLTLGHRGRRALAQRDLRQRRAPAGTADAARRGRDPGRRHADRLSPSRAPAGAGDDLGSHHRHAGCLRGTAAGADSALPPAGRRRDGGAGDKRADRAGAGAEPIGGQGPSPRALQPLRPRRSARRTRSACCWPSGR